ncbi:MAG: hypothetical protein K2N48_10520 [Muribaculaceae bacterium]|nr:hypothetical protein [Muribaculaceae bacterium]
MNPLREWAQHNLLRGLTSKNNADLNKKLFPEIRKKWFVSPKYKRAFALLKSIYLKEGRFPSWKSFIANPSLSAEDSKYLRTKEIKRKSNEKEDVSLRIPRTEEEYNGLVSRMKFDARHVSVIKLHNRLASALDNDDMTPDELDYIIAEIKGEANKTSEDMNTRGEHVSLTLDSIRPLMKKAYKETKEKFYIPTGFKAFDSINIGIPTSSLFVIIGKTGAGKSSLGLNIGMNSKEVGARVAFVPLEMTVSEMLVKMASRLLKVPVNELMQNPKRSFKRMIKVLRDFFEDTGEDGASCFDFYVPESSDTVEDVLTYLEPYNYDLIILDYPKLLSTGNLPEWEALDKGAKFAKKFSTRNKTYVLWIAQMDDTTEAIRYSRAVMEHASNAWVISGDIDENRESGQVLIKQRKARGQSPHSFNLKQDLSYSFFGDMDDETIGDEPINKKKRKKKDEELEEDDVKTTKEIQDKTRKKKTKKGRVKIKVGPGLDEMSAADDTFMDVPEEY